MGAIWDHLKSSGMSRSAELAVLCSPNSKFPMQAVSNIKKKTAFGVDGTQFYFGCGFLLVGSSEMGYIELHLAYKSRCLACTKQHIPEKGSVWPARDDMCLRKWSFGVHESAVFFLVFCKHTFGVHETLLFVCSKWLNKARLRMAEVG